MNIDKFLELYNLGVETDYSDFKQELVLNTKKQKYNLVKDFLAFANYGGGYILIGVNDKTHEFESIKKKIDPAVVGGIVEGAIGFNIQFHLRYFDHSP